MGMRTVQSQAAMVEAAAVAFRAQYEGQLVGRLQARIGDGKRVVGQGRALWQSRVAQARHALARQSRALPMRAQGTWNTVPMETRDARRNSGSWQAGVSSTASMPRAAALRKMAPMLV